MSARNKKRKRLEVAKQETDKGKSAAHSECSQQSTRLLLSRRNFMRAGALALVGITGLGGYLWYTKEPSDTDVFDETNGDPSAEVECLKQIHAGTELGRAARMNPVIIDHFVAHQQGLLRKLVRQHEQQPDSLYFLEGATPSVQQRLLQNREFVEIVEAVRARLERDPAGTILHLKEILRVMPPEAVGLYLKHFEATAQFLVHSRNSRPRIQGTEPDGYLMLSDFLAEQLDALRQLQQQGRLTDQAIDDAVGRINAKMQEEMPLRHRYIRDTLATQLHEGQKSQVVLGAAHFRSGVNLSQSEDPLEDYLITLRNRRIRVVDEGHLPAILQSMPRAQFVRTFTRDNVRSLLQRA